MNRKTGSLLAAVLGSGVVSLDASDVTVALPRIGRELHSSVFGILEGQSYIYNGYSLALSALLVLAGALNDFYGRRRVFTAGVAAFGLSSILAGLAPNMELLVLFRVLQGAAGAFLTPASLSLITAAFTGEEQGRAFGLWSAAAAVISTLGPFVGGLLVDTVSWRMVFLINVPLVAGALWIARQYVPESRDDEATGQFDVLGAVVAGVAVGGLAFGAIYGQQREWRDPLAFVMLAVGAGGAVLFPFLMMRSPHPLVPLELFRSRNFTVTNLSTFVIYGALSVVFYYLTLFMQGTLGYSAAAVGLAYIPEVCFLVLFSSRFGTLASRYGPRWFMAVGPVVMAVGVLLWARAPAQSQAWLFRPGAPATFVPPYSYVTDFLPGLVVFGIGIMIMVAPLTTALMTSLPVRRSGVGSAINNAISEVGPQLAGALIFVAITAGFYTHLAALVPGLDTSSAAVRRDIAPLNPPPAGTDVAEAAAIRDASTRAFHLAMLIGAALLVGGAVINAIGIQPRSALKPAEVVSAHPHWKRSCALAQVTGPDGKERNRVPPRRSAGDQMEIPAQ
ncbi:MAG TPA: MFS transporter [bacterium]|nr:MFS transporter [bacterium]